MSKVSIILPVYNAEKTLARCLKSILNQTLQDIQVIAINNGSKDNSVKILKRYKDKIPNFKLVDKVNGSMSTVKNIGISLADGEYIAFINPTDTIEKEYIEEMYSKAKSENLDVVVSDICKLNYLGSEILLGANVSKKIDFSIVSDYTFIYNKIYNREYIDTEFQNLLYYDNLKWQIDVFLKNPKIAYLNKPLYNLFEKVDRSIINKKHLEKRVHELFKVLNSYSSNVEEIEYICIDILLYNLLDKFMIIPSMKTELINMFKVKYIYWKKNKYFKSKSFKYKFRCVKTFSKLNK